MIRLRTTPAARIGACLCWLLLAQAAAARADTVTLNDGRRFEGTVVKKTADVLTFELDLFVTGKRGRPERLQLAIPMALISEKPVEDRTPASRVTLPAGNAPAVEKLAAAEVIIRHGGTTSLDQAQQYVDEAYRAGAQPDRATAALLRFRLADLVAEWSRQQTAEGRAAVAQALAPLRSATDVILEYISYLVLSQSLDMRADARRDKLVDQLRQRLLYERAEFLKFVARSARTPPTDDAAWRADLQQRLRTLRALVSTPGSPAALRLTRLAGESVASLDALLGLCEAAAPAAPAAPAPDAPAADNAAWLDRIQTAVKDQTGEWRTRIPPDYVVGWCDSRRDANGDTLLEVNAGIDTGINAMAFADIADGASRQVRETLEEEKAVFRAINDYRAMLGLTCLRFNRNLWRAAAAHAERCKGG
ncbi:MAG: hypothetical protein AB7S36_15060, partial [Planctomycetota bacterium]